MSLSQPQPKTGRRTDHAVDDYLMDWTQTNLPNAKDFFITDVDMVIRDRDDNIMILEVKRRKGNVSVCQSTTLQLIAIGLKEIDGKQVQTLHYKDRARLEGSQTFNHIIKYHGIHFLQFENTTFEDGKVYFNRREISERELIEILSFKRCTTCF